MGSLFSSPKPKYDTSPQKQSQISQKAARHRHQSAHAQIQTQIKTKEDMKTEIKEQLTYATGNFILVKDFNKIPIHHILDGMDNLLYLKERMWSKGSQTFLVKMGNNLKEFIPRYMKMYPAEKEIISNLKTKFKAIYGTSYNRFNNWIAGYSR